MKSQGRNKIELTPTVKSLKSTLHTEEMLNYKTASTKKLADKYL